jgi:hypothetical protein
MPFFSVAFGLAAGGIKNTIRNKNALRVAGLIVLITLLLGHAVATIDKSSQLQTNGQLANRLLVQLVPYATELSAGGTMLLLNPASPRVEYSVYRMNGFNVLRFGAQHRIRQLSSRHDINVRIVDAIWPSPTPVNTPRLILTLVNDGKVVRW